MNCRGAAELVAGFLSVPASLWWCFSTCRFRLPAYRLPLLFFSSQCFALRKLRASNYFERMRVSKKYRTKRIGTRFKTSQASAVRAVHSCGYSGRFPKSKRVHIFISLVFSAAVIAATTTAIATTAAVAAATAVLLPLLLLLLQPKRAHPIFK